MDTNNIFKKSDWIAQGKVWASALPMVRKTAAEFFSIPQTSSGALFFIAFSPFSLL
ncbi:hypothetical protein B0H10DRAFT_2141026 [Mycena sp. CBHHK59/15]|nr:hypothetical protein B0H10DRAFT_2151371 [Mycena sp. CBHHK59/15]KAJ6530905.1 hypothetical protein B0H10DRAFT_2151414 [Mycena sp. CBHHK59/15]KAJ6538294.1 hypothetical protein B0H10DRAFT_2141026 [Mycena sp. CBHHK59/15]